MAKTWSKTADPDVRRRFGNALEIGVTATVGEYLMLMNILRQVLVIKDSSIEFVANDGDEAMDYIVRMYNE